MSSDEVRTTILTKQYGACAPLRLIVFCIFFVICLVLRFYVLILLFFYISTSLSKNNHRLIHH